MLKRLFRLEIIVGTLLIAVLLASLQLNDHAHPTDERISQINIAIPDDVQDITMTDMHGDPVRLRDLRGSYAVVAFGYTHCPDVCPLTLSDFSRIKRSLSDDEEAQVEFVFISIDGARDTPDVMRRFVSRFDEAFIGMTTADDTKLRPVADAFDVYYERHVVEGTAMDYVCDHTAAFFVMDPDGNIIRRYPFGIPPNEMSRDLSDLL